MSQQINMWTLFFPPLYLLRKKMNTSRIVREGACACKHMGNQLMIAICKYALSLNLSKQTSCLVILVHLQCTFGQVLCLVCTFEQKVVCKPRLIKFAFHITTCIFLTLDLIAKPFKLGVSSLCICLCSIVIMVRPVIGLLLFPTVWIVPLLL